MSLRALTLALALLAGPAGAGALRCAPPPFDAEPEMRATLSALAPAFALFPRLAETLATLDALCLSSGARDAQGYFEPETGRIVLAADLAPGLAQAVLVHELRHAQQFARGVCPSPDLAMRDHAQAVFAMEADASVTSLVVAEAMREQGAPEMWEALAGWPMQADIAEAFAAARSETGDLAAAAARAFDAWYRDEDRRDAYYVAACLDYLEAREKDHRLPRYESLGAEFYTRICRLPSGAPYGCAPPD